MKGFTLIEIMLALAITTILFAFTVPIYLIFQNRNDLDIAANTMAQDYRRAQLLSQAVDGDASWGVKVQSGEITIFRGDDFDFRDRDYDENLEMPTSITASGTTETVFEKFTGYPRSPGTLTLMSPNNETRTITLNEKGIVSY